MMRAEDYCGVIQTVYERETCRGTTYDIAEWKCPSCGKSNSTMRLEGEAVHGDILSIRYVDGERTIGCGSCLGEEFEVTGCRRQSG